MNIVFWSLSHGLSSVSASLLAVSGFTAGLTSKRVTIMQTQFSGNYLMPALLNDDLNDQAFSSVGIDQLIRLAQSGMITKDSVESSTFGFMDGRINIVPGTNNSDRSLYVQSFVSHAEQILSGLDSVFDYTFIDVPAGANPISRVLLPLADVVCVCLPQNTLMLNDVIKNLPNLPKEKVYYLIGNYDAKSSLSLTNIMLKHRKIFNKRNLGCIAHCSAFMDAMSGKKSLSFLMQNVEAAKGDNNLAFSHSVKDAVNGLTAICDKIRDEKMRR